MSSWPGYGLPVPASQPAPNRLWGGTQSPIYAARTAAEVDAIIRAQSGQAVDFTPSHGWHFDEPGAGTEQANDYVGVAHLFSQGALATRTQGPTGPDDRAVKQVLNQATGAWRCNDLAHVNMTTNAFAFAARMRFPVLGSGGWWLSKSSIGANGYFGAGANNAPGLTMGLRATDATTAAASATSTGYDDNTWRWVLVGRDIASAVVWVTSLLGSAETAFLAAKDIGNTSAGAYFGLWFNLFAGGIGGVTCDISDLLCWRDTAAANVFTHRQSLRTVLENPA